MFEYGEALT
jgi:KRAB domain-containing zinc finger protein